MIDGFIELSGRTFAVLVCIVVWWFALYGAYFVARAALEYAKWRLKR